MGTPFQKRKGVAQAGVISGGRFAKSVLFYYTKIMINQTCVAVVITNNENKILIAKEKTNKSYEKSKGLWTLPAGKVEAGESLLDAARREVKEEVGCDIKLTDAIGVYNLSSNKNISVSGVAFRAELINDKISGAEFTDIHWVNVADINKSRIKFRKGIREIIEDYRKNKTISINQGSIA
jgi:8-oxo-dGTP diphosphatase